MSIDLLDILADDWQPHRVKAYRARIMATEGNVVDLPRALPAYALAECIDIYTNHLQTPIVAVLIRTNKAAELN